MENVRKTLLREDGLEGGILLIVRKEIANNVRKEVERLGLRVEVWDNGSPF